MSKFFDSLGQELFLGALFVRPSVEARNYMDYGVIMNIGQFYFKVSSIRASQTFLPPDVEVTPIEESFTSAIDHGILVLHPAILQRSHVEVPRPWKEVLLNQSFNALRNIRHPNE